MRGRTGRTLRPPSRLDRRLTVDLTVFASGSTGNCCLIRHGGAGVLVDAGISARRIRTALAEVGMTPAELTAILITHEHSDHIKGLCVFLKSAPVPVYAPETVAAYLCRTVPGAFPLVRVIEPETPLREGPFEITAFPTPHDTPQSAGYRLSAEGSSIAVCTDTGCVTEVMRRHLRGADVALIEANHDVEMLKTGPYPPYLKRRILSDRGHLSNDDCALLASELSASGTRHIVLGHLSRENNAPAVARRAVSRALEGTGTALSVAPEAGFLRVEAEPCCV